MRTAHREEILEELAARGYPLTYVQVGTAPQMTTERVLIELLNTSENGRLLEGCAIIINNSPPNYEKLIQLSKENGIQNQIGYLLEGSLQLIKKYKPNKDTKELEKAVNELFEARRTGDIEFLGHINLPNSKEIILGMKREKEAIKWNVTGGVPYSQLETQFVIYKNAAQ